MFYWIPLNTTSSTTVLAIKMNKHILISLVLWNYNIVTYFIDILSYFTID